MHTPTHHEPGLPRFPSSSRGQVLASTRKAGRRRIGHTSLSLVPWAGGPATAKLFGVRPSAVSNWKRSGQLPERLHYRIDQEAARRGIPVDERLFETGKH